MITTRLSPEGHPAHNGKWEAAAQAVRLIREMRGMLEEAGMLPGEDYDRVNNVLYAFEKTLPKKIQSDLAHG